MFQSRVDRTDPRTLEAALAAPIEKPDMLESTTLLMLCLVWRGEIVAI